MTQVNLSKVEFDQESSRISFYYMTESGGKEKPGITKTVSLRIGGGGRPDSGKAWELAQLLLSKEQLKKMTDKEVNLLAQSTAGIFKTLGVKGTWLKLMRATFKDVEAYSTNDGQSRTYWEKFNPFLVRVEQEYTGLKDWQVDLIDRSQPKTGF